MKTCPRCGVENKPEKAACWNCWAPLEGPAGAAAAPRPTGRGLSLAVPWTAVAVVLGVLVMAAIAYFFFLSSKPADVADQYLHAVRNGNAAKAERLSSRDTKTDKLLPDVIMVADYQVQREGVSIAGKTATVSATVHLTVDPTVIGLERAVLADAIMQFLQQHPVHSTVAMVKEGFAWRVDQKQTREQFTQQALRDLPPGLALQVAALITGGPLPSLPSAAGLLGGKAPTAGPLAPAGQRPVAPGTGAAPRPAAPGAGLGAPGRPGLAGGQGAARPSGAAAGVAGPGPSSPQAPRPGAAGAAGSRTATPSSGGASAGTSGGGLRRSLPSESEE